MEKCEDCSEEAGYICICQEQHLCSECLIQHITGDKFLQHRTVSLSHPLLSLLLESNDDSDENIEPDPLHATANIQVLEEFRDKCIQLIELKIKVLEEQDAIENNPIHKLTVPAWKSRTPLPTYRESHDKSYFSNKGLSARSTRPRDRKNKDTHCSPGSIYRVSPGRSPNTEQFLYRVIVCGREKSGKSCIISSFKHMHETSTESASLLCKSIMIENLKVSLEVIESRSGEASNNALGALVVFDLTNRESLMEAEKTIERLECTNHVLGVVILVGTRLDLVVNNPQRRISSFGSIQKFAINRRIFYDEISAVNYGHVEELFMRLVRELHKKSNSLT